MEKIDTSEWKFFSMSELGFKNFHGERLNKSQRIEGIKPFVTAGKDNRGVTQYIGNDRKLYHLPVTVDMFGNCFYHPYDCAGDDNVYFFVNDDLSENEKLFISVSINAQTSKKYAYIDQFRQGDADELGVYLPVDSHEQPDWAFMDRFMENTMKRSKASLSDLRLSYKEKKSVSLVGWSEFKIEELFDVVKGSRLTKANMQPGEENIGSLAHLHFKMV